MPGRFVNPCSRVEDSDVLGLDAQLCSQLFIGNAVTQLPAEQPIQRVKPALVAMMGQFLETLQRDAAAAEIRLSVAAFVHGGEGFVAVFELFAVKVAALVTTLNDSGWGCRRHALAGGGGDAEGMAGTGLHKAWPNWFTKQISGQSSLAIPRCDDRGGGECQRRHA